MIKENVLKIIPQEFAKAVREEFSPPIMKEISSLKSENTLVKGMIIFFKHISFVLLLFL